MLKDLKTCSATLIIAVLALGLAPAVSAKTVLKLSSTPPGTAPFLYLSAFANMVNKHVSDVEVQINATGVATRHYVEATRGTIDLFYNTPLFHGWMVKGARFYKKVKHGPEIAKKVSTLLSFKLAIYHVLTRADSGIKSLKDIKGRKVYLGPPAGGATFIATGIVEGSSGYKLGKDFTVLRLGWGAGLDAFRDRQVDVVVNPNPVPAAVLQQIALTTKVRFLGIPQDKLGTKRIKGLLGSPGRTKESLAPDAYGKNQVNTKPVITVGSWGGIGVRSSISPDLAYKMTKAFWDNIGEVYKKAAGFRDAIKFKNALKQIASPLHPGAARYYREKGVKIPARLLAK